MGFGLVFLLDGICLLCFNGWMHGDDYVWLGSKRVIKAGVADKAALLDKAMQARLPVPAGIVLLDSAWHSALETELVSVVDGVVVVHDPAGLQFLIVEADFERPVAIHPVFSAESQLGVDSYDPAGFSGALQQVWTAALSVPGRVRRDILIMEMVNAQQAGLALTEQAYQDDLVHSTQGANLTETQLPQLQMGELPTEQENGGLARLQKLLRGVRRTFGAGDWQIEWADDGEVCWLVQIQPLTRPTNRNETFALVNLPARLPSPPTVFMASLIAHCAGAFYEVYGRFDGTLPTSRPLVVVRGGWPYLNVGLLADTARAWGLPTRLVGEAGVGLKWGRCLGKRGVLVRQATAHRRAVGSTQVLLDELVNTRPGTSFASHTQEWITLTVRVGQQMLLLASALAVARGRSATRLVAVRDALYEQVGETYGQLGGRLLLLADGAVERGLLPGRDALWYLSLEEVQALDEGHPYDQAFIETRQAEFGQINPDPPHKLTNKPS